MPVNRICGAATRIVACQETGLNVLFPCISGGRDSRPTLGVSDAEHSLVEDHAAHDEFTAAEQAALTFAELFATDSTAISDELITTLVEHLGPAGLVDLTLVVGKYIAMGRFMQVLGLDQSCELDPERVARIHG